MNLQKDTYFDGFKSCSITEFFIIFSSFFGISQLMASHLTWPEKIMALLTFWSLPSDPWETWQGHYKQNLWTQIQGRKEKKFLILSEIWIELDLLLAWGILTSLMVLLLQWLLWGLPTSLFWFSSGSHEKKLSAGHQQSLPTS